MSILCRPAGVVLLAAFTLAPGCRIAPVDALVDYGPFPSSSALRETRPFSRMTYFMRRSYHGRAPGELVHYVWADNKFMGHQSEALQYTCRVSVQDNRTAFKAIAVTLMLRHPFSPERRELAGFFLDYFERHFSEDFSKLREAIGSAAQGRPPVYYQVPFSVGLVILETNYYPDTTSDFVNITFKAAGKP